MVIKKVVAIIALVMIASLCVAGCTVTNTGNPSPSETQNATPLYQITTTTTNATSNAITDSYASAGYDIIKPFTSGTNQYGNDVYAGVVRDNSSHLSIYEHNITIEIMKNKSETLERGTQMRDNYVKQGYSIPNLTSGVYFVSRSSDATAAHPLVITLDDPSQINLPYQFNRYTVAVDMETKIE
jgi:hypothetical protein